MKSSPTMAASGKKRWLRQAEQDASTTTATTPHDETPHVPPPPLKKRLAQRGVEDAVNTSYDSGMNAVTTIEEQRTTISVFDTGPLPEVVSTLTNAMRMFHIYSCYNLLQYCIDDHPQPTIRTTPAAAKIKIEKRKVTYDEYKKRQSTDAGYVLIPILSINYVLFSTPLTPSVNAMDPFKVDAPATTTSTQLFTAAITAVSTTTTTTVSGFMPDIRSAASASLSLAPMPDPAIIGKTSTTLQVG
jgi:hypothetical protein